MIFRKHTGNLPGWASTSITSNINWISMEKYKSLLFIIWWFMNLLCRLVAKHLNMWVNSRILMEVYFVCFYIYSGGWDSISSLYVFLHIVVSCTASRTHKSLWFQLTGTLVYSAPRTHTVIFKMFAATVSCAHNVPCVRAYSHSHNVCPSLN